MRGLRRDVDSAMDAPDVIALLSDQEFIKALWETVTSRPIQYRMLMSYIEARRLLIQTGVPEAILPLTEELKRRAQEGDRLAADSQSRAAQG
jgi:hypothetical protein